MCPGGRSSRTCRICLILRTLHLELSSKFWTWTLTRSSTWSRNHTCSPAKPCPTSLRNRWPCLFIVRARIKLSKCHGLGKPTRIRYTDKFLIATSTFSSTSLSESRRPLSLSCTSLPTTARSSRIWTSKRVFSSSFSDKSLGSGIQMKSELK